jgi:hypothetical protein
VGSAWIPDQYVTVHCSETKIHSRRFRWPIDCLQSTNKEWKDVCGAQYTYNMCSQATTMLTTLTILTILTMLTPALTCAAKLCSRTRAGKVNLAGCVTSVARPALATVYVVSSQNIAERPTKKQVPSPISNLSPAHKTTRRPLRLTIAHHAITPN